MLPAAVEVDGEKLPNIQDITELKTTVRDTAALGCSTVSIQTSEFCSRQCVHQAVSFFSPLDKVVSVTCRCIIFMWFKIT